MNTELKQLIEDAAKAQAEKQEPFPFSADRVTYHKTAAIGAIMPCGTMVTNVKEAYKAGQKAQAEKQEPVKQEPDFFVVVDETGAPEFTSLWPEFCHAHINSAINEFDIEGAAKWKVVPLYTRPQPDLTAEVERLRQICRDAYEVWAGSNGIPEPITCVEAYLLQLLIAMRDEVKRGLK